MLFLEEAYFALAALLLLSIATIALCKSEKRRPESYAEFLFAGKTFFHSIVSSAGAIFSVTYLLGATIIYATIYRAWTFLMALAVVTISALVINRIIRLACQELSAERIQARDRHLLLSFMKKRLKRRNFDIFVQLLSLTFLLLLVEELAIGRLVLQSLLPEIALLPAFLLFVIVTVIFFYLSIGGFRALLNSDLVQAVVLVAFLLVLLFFVSGTQDSVFRLASESQVGGFELLWANISWIIYGTGFLVTAVDLFARLNFEAPDHIAIRMRRAFVVISMVALLLIVSIGILFGLALSPDLGHFQSASAYYSTVVEFFAASDTFQVKVVFLIALFCMIFTTVDTLLLAVMQIRFYQSRLGSKRSDLSTVLVLAIALSILVDVDAVCAFGIFVGSVLLLPCSQLICQVFPLLPLRRIEHHQYLWLALVIAAVTFIAFYEGLAHSFPHQYLIPLIVVMSLLVSAVIWDLYRRTRR